MNLAGLLRELETLTHDARARRMVELGRNARGDRSVPELLAALERGDVYERGLALTSCYGSGDGAHVLRGLADPSRSLRGLALCLVAIVCDDEQVQAALAMLPPRSQVRLLRRLATRRRREPIDAFLAAVSDDRVGPLLGFASPALAAARAEQALASAGPTALRRLARLHPHLAATLLLRRAEGAERLDQRLRWLANAVLPILARQAPDDALILVQALRAHLPLGQLALGPLLRRRPKAVADLLLASGESARFDFSRAVSQLDPERLAPLVACGLLGEPGAWLDTIAPAHRGVLYEQFSTGWRDSEGVLGLDVVLALPGPHRVAEARRHIALPALATRPAQRLPYAAGLPWDEARAALEPFARNPDPALRVVALTALLGTARFQRERLSDALQLVLDRRHEQDPVRLAMLCALADLPPTRWEDGHLADLGQAIRDALDAADCSAATAAQAQRLVLALLPTHPNWAAGWLATLGRERGTFGYASLEQRLTPTDVRGIAPALLPVLAAWEPREREQAIFQAAALFGRRLEFFPGLVSVLERLTHDKRGWVASQALSLIAVYRGDLLSSLVPALVAEDQSWVTQPVVYGYLHRRRQDLLTPFLGQSSFRGRFATGKTRFVLPLLSGFERWTPGQQAAFARLLEQLTRDEQRDSPALLQAIKQLAALPALPPTRIVQLADARNPRLALREVALRALGRLDGGEGVPVLLQALDDERARVAIYALRRALLELPAERARALLREVPLRRITVAKEVIRLLGELPGDLAYGDLLAIAGEELHRDVRVALLRALWKHLERAETWPLLERAARDADPAVAAGVIRIPVERLSTESQRRIVALLATLLVHPEPQVRLDTLNRCATLPVADEAQALRPALLAAVISPLPDERAIGARAVFATYVGRQAGAVGELVQASLANSRALLSLVGTLRGALHWDPLGLRATAQAVVQALDASPLATTLQVQLAAEGLAWDELITLLRRLAADDALHAEATMAVVTSVMERAARADGDGLATLEAALRAAPDERLRRIALAALVGLACPPRGWSRSLRELLVAYRADPVPLVAGAAHATFADEEALPAG
jgi:hypothetical protein